MINSYTPLPGFTCGGSDPTLPCYTQDARGVVKNFSYATFNRITALKYSTTSGGADPFNTPPVSYQYDAGGAAVFALTRLTSITEGPATPTPVNSQTFTYDNLGRTKSVKQTIDAVDYTTQYAYNLLGQLNQITYPSGDVVAQNYDSLGRLCTIGTAIGPCNSGSNYLSGLSYNAAGETLGLTMGNGVQGTFTYNDHLQLASLRYFKTGLTPDPLNLSYDYTSTAQPTNNGQIQAIHYFTQPGTEDQTKSESFTYDAWLRLKAAQTINVDVNTPDTWSLTWAYDRLGNRKQQTLTGGNLPGGIGQPNFTINENTNQISGFTYDNAGNLTNDGAFTYTYDGANRMKLAQQIASPNTTTTSTYFGPLRIKKAVGSSTTLYIYSGSEPIAEYVNGSLSKEYIYAGSTLLATIAGASATYHHPDHLSNRAETDSNGTLIRNFGHFPYGESWYESSPDPLKFTSYPRDSGTGETGLDYATFREYNSGQARFMIPDFLNGHISMPQSQNRYIYVMNDPINWLDPMGLDHIGYFINGNGCLQQMIYTSTFTIDEKGVAHQTVNATLGSILACSAMGLPSNSIEPVGNGGGGGGGGVSRVCSVVPDVTTGGVGFDVNFIGTTGWQFGLAANGNSGQLGINVTQNANFGVTAYDAYVYAGAIWNASDNSQVGGGGKFMNFSNTGSASIGKTGLTVDQHGNVTATYGPSLFPYNISGGTSRSFVPVNIPFLGYLVNSNRTLCKIFGRTK